MAEKLGLEALAFDARMWSNGHRADRYRNLGWVSNENLLAAVKVIDLMGITLTEDGDALVDRLFAHVVVTKPDLNE